MTRVELRHELEQRLIDLDKRIEASKTTVWLLETEREEVRCELRCELQRPLKETTT
jgi:hypothetical protein